MKLTEIFPTRNVGALRTAPLLAVLVVSFCITIAINPTKVGLAIRGVAKLGCGGYVGYWID